MICIHSDGMTHDMQVPVIDGNQSEANQNLMVLANRNLKKKLNLAMGKPFRPGKRNDILIWQSLLFYGIATVFQLYHGSDMMSEIRRRKPEPTLLLTQYTILGIMG